MSYEDKYLKYKTKYLQLKAYLENKKSESLKLNVLNMFGGADDENLEGVIIGGAFKYVLKVVLRLLLRLTHRLLAVHAVHLRQKLIQHAVSGASGVTSAAATLDGDRVQLVEEEHTGSAATGLVKDLTDVGL